MLGRKNKNTITTTTTTTTNKPRPAPVTATPQSGVTTPAIRRKVDQASLADRDTTLVNIGRSVHIKGELTGNEDLTIDGKVEGRIQLENHNLTISLNGHITAEVSAKSVVIFGHVVGDVRAEDRIEIAKGGLVEGDLIAPKVVLADGARFKGRIDMLSGTSAADAESKDVWEDPVETSAFVEAPDAFVDDVIDEIVEGDQPKQESGAKKQDSKGSNDEPKDSESFDKFDPANP